MKRPAASVQQFDDLFQLLGAIQPWAAAEASRRSTRREIEALEAELERAEHISRTGTSSAFTEFVEHDTRSYTLVVRASGNPLVKEAFIRTRCLMHLFSVHKASHSNDTMDRAEVNSCRTCFGSTTAAVNAPRPEWAYRDHHRHQGGDRDAARELMLSQTDSSRRRFSASVLSVNCDSRHQFSKSPRDSIALIEGLGVEGDAHLGTTVRHRSRVAIDPTAPNLRQVHLIHSELFAEVADAGFTVRPGDLGENVTTTGIDLLELPRGTILELGGDARVEITGLRNPCVQIDSFRRGLLKTMVSRDAEGRVVRKAGVMGVVLTTGDVHPGDRIVVRLPPEPHEALKRV